MIKNKMKLLLSAGLIFIFALGLFAFQGQIAAQDNSITLGYVDWACAEAKTYVVQAVLEEEMGYNVELTMVDAGPVYASLSTGDIDAFLASWLPVTHHHYVEQYQNEIIKTGLNYTGARIGLVVPEYVDVDHIEELNEYADQFDNRIVGIDPGAGIMEATYEAIDHYDLDFNLIESSGPAMTASLSEAIENEEWIAVTGWEPHWKFAEFDLKFIEDPDNIYGEIERVYSFTRQGLSSDHPEVVNFLHDFRMNSEQLGSVMGWIAEDMDPEDAARQYIDENQKQVSDWITPYTVSD